MDKKNIKTNNMILKTQKTIAKNFLDYNKVKKSFKKELDDINKFYDFIVSHPFYFNSQDVINFLMIKNYLVFRIVELIQFEIKYNF